MNIVPFNNALFPRKLLDAGTLKQAGVDMVLQPFIDAAKKAAQKLIKGMVMGQHHHDRQV
ncbi:MAG: hypothetical protein ACMUIS_02880 [bacterium]